MYVDYKELELLIKLGEYQAGNNPESDEAVKRSPALMRFLQQGTREQFTLEETVQLMSQLAYE